MTIGLRGKATATPVDRCSSGAASWAAAIDSHGVRLISVKTRPAKPAFSTVRASRCTSPHGAGSVITSTFMLQPSRPSRSSSAAGPIARWRPTERGYISSAGRPRHTRPAWTSVCSGVNGWNLAPRMSR